MKDIVSNNKKIAKFMGIESYKFRGYDMFVYADNNHRTEIDLSYHNSWAWLMPVIERIEGTDIDGHYCDVRIETTETKIVDDTFNTVFESDNPESKIQRTIDVVMEFIDSLSS